MNEHKILNINNLSNLNIYSTWATSNLRGLKEYNGTIIESPYLKWKIENYSLEKDLGKEKERRKYKKIVERGRKVE